MQVAFYFGDVNLPKDKFMWESTGGSQNKPVPLSTIVSFGRMRHFKPYSAIVEALKTSDSLDMTLSEKEGEELVKRKVPFDPVEAQSAKKKAMASSVYAKGFGDEWDTAQYDIEAFFEKYGEIELVKLRRTQPENLFKGSVFVQFVDSETADKFVELSPKWKDVHPLKIMKKSEYTEEKSRLIAEGKIEGSKSYSRPFDGLQQMRDGQRGRGGKFQGGGKRDGGNQNGHGHGGRGGRGRGRGRGGRGGRGGGRGGHGRDNKSRDRNGQADKSPSENAGVNGWVSPLPHPERVDHEANSFDSVTRPQIGTSAPLATAKDSTENNANGKRVRDEADGAGLKEPPAKKVSTEGVTNA